MRSPDATALAPRVDLGAVVRARDHHGYAPRPATRQRSVRARGGRGRPRRGDVGAPLRRPVAGCPASRRWSGRGIARGAGGRPGAPTGALWRDGRDDAVIWRGTRLGPDLGPTWTRLGPDLGPDLGPGTWC